MRTTLDLDDDLLLAAKELARREGKTAGEVVSELVRQALAERQAPPRRGKAGSRPKEFLGFRPLPRTGSTVVTNELINQLREQEGI
jgi:hypothetical protein